MNITDKNSYCLARIFNELLVCKVEKFYTDFTGKDNEIVFILKPEGATYEEKKNNLRDKAIEYQNISYEYAGLSYGEIAILERFFETYGRRFGLLNEFHENCIC